ncbi:MAG: adenine-specific DNA-methyltransferase [Actinomycetota bacterium]|nr:adenine-specific DNA-methyltransferase [Actinomycetota bacterium]
MAVKGERPVLAVSRPPAEAEPPETTGLYLHWDGRRNYRTRMPAPRVLEPIKRYSYGSADGSRLIEGDNLQVMVSLRSQYRSRVDIAYLDPPYNTGRDDLWYSDRRFQDPNADARDAVYISSEDGGRHTKWLNYMGPRLHLVWELLADHGVCFVSINDVELFRLGMLMDEIFLERNRVGVVVWKGAIDNNPTRIVAEHEYVLVYAKNKDLIDRVWTGEHEAQPWLLSTYQTAKDAHGDDLQAVQKAYQRAITDQVNAYTRDISETGSSERVDLGRAKRYRLVDTRGPYAAEDNTHNPKPGGKIYDVVHPVTGRVVKKPSNGYRFPRDRFEQLLRDDRVVFGRDETTLFKVKAYVSEMSGPLRSVVTLPAKSGALRLQSLLPEAQTRFAHPKPVELMEMLLSFGGNSSAVVLDPFAGSGTTGHAVMSLNAKDGGNRRFLLIEEGAGQDRFARTLTAARLRAAITKEDLPGGFIFEGTGKRVNREVILELERDAIANLIIQTDVTGVGRGITKVSGKYVIGVNARNEAITLCWNGRTRSKVDREVLRAMLKEVKEQGFNKPLRVYGTTCSVGETESFRFCQIPDEILAALQFAEEAAESEDQALRDGLEVLEAAVQEARLAVQGR